MKTEVTVPTKRAHHAGGKSMGNSPSSLDPPYHLQPEQQQDAGDAGPITAEEPLPSTAASKNARKLSLVPLIFLIFFEVSGGPFAEEPAVAAAGPLLAILGFLIFPFIWSIPEALITAELATAYPGNGGYVIWATKAFGPFWGSLMGSWKFLSGSINNAAYPVLCADYVKRLFPIFSSGLPRNLAIALFTIILTFLNYTGLTIVGYTAVTFGVIALLPFLLMTGFALPKLHPRRWGSLGNKQKDWNLYFNTLFWNLNFWDNASALAGEVDRPQETFPKALFSSGILVCIGYILPLLAATGSLNVPQDQWTSGFLADAAGMIAGRWLKIWVDVGSVLSSMGLFEAQLSTCAYQVDGMAGLGFLPRFTGIRSTWFNTPWVGIVMTSAITLGVSFIGFENIIASANFLYSLGMLLEFASFIWLRRKYPELKRPYKVPMGMAGVVAMLLVPSGFLVYVMVIAGKIVFLISGALTALGLVGIFLMRWCKQKGWMEFQEAEAEAEAEAEEGGGRGGGMLAEAEEGGGRGGGMLAEAGAGV